MTSPNDEHFRQQLRLFDAISATTPDFLYVFDRDGRIVYANRRLLEVWGRSAEDAVGKNLYELDYPRWHADMHVRELRQVIDTRQPVMGEVPFTGGSGISGVYEYIFSPVLGPDGEVELVAGTTRDVTDRRRALEQARSILESITDAFFALDGEWRFTYLNPQAGHVLGRAPSEMLGRVLWDEYPGLHGSEFERVYRRVASGREAASFTAFYPDHQRWYEVHVYPAPDGLSVYFRDVTEQKRADAERQQLTERSAAQSRVFDRVLSSITDFAYTFDLDGRFTFANKPLLDLWGLTLPEVVGKNFLDLKYPAELAAKLQRQIREVIDTRRIVVDHTPYTPSSGRTGFYQYIFSPIVGAGGAVEAVAGSTRDMTNEKRAESRDRFLLTLEAAVRPLTDPAGITAAHARLLGEHLAVDRCAYADVEADEDTFNLTGDHTRGVPSIVGRYTFGAFGAEVLRLMRADEPYVAEDVDAYRPPLGDLSAYRATMIRAVVCVPLHKGGRFVAAMAVHQRVPRAWAADEVELVRHVAARCWESIERARVQRTLRESEARFRGVVEATPECVKIVAADGSLAWMNPAGLGMVEADAMPAVQDACVFDLIVDEHRAGWVEHHGRVCAGEKLTWEFEVVGLRGTRRWMETHAVPLRMPDGTTGQLAVTREITGRKNADLQREQLLQAERAARAEGERQGRMKDEFLATLSHELRTPLNAIVGWATILATGSADAADVRDGLATILRNARAQTQIIEDLLDMSRIISGKARLDVQRVDLAPLVQAAVDTVRPAAEAKDIRVRAVLDPHAGPVSGDPSRLQQVFWNLLSNAVKFTPRGGRVQVLLERVNSHLEVSVVDTGEGIRPEFLPHVFDRFRQADASSTRRHGGLGLGLAIARQLVELHGGSVHAKSPGEGHGATFSVFLPVTVVHPDLEPVAERRHPASANYAPALDRDASSTPEPCPQLAGLRVVVVDDEPDARALVKRLLADCDAVVRTAASADEAIDLIAAETPDVLVSDIGMPGQDGYDLIRRVRSLDPSRGGDLPAVALTAYARSEDRVKALRAGFQTHVAKPVEPAELIMIVASLANRRK